MLPSWLCAKNFRHSTVALSACTLANVKHSAAFPTALALQVEAMKHGFAVRTALGDPGTPKQPFPHAAAITAAVKDLLDDAFVDKLRAATKDDGVLPDTEYGGR
jgi:gamma-glutamyltranspeptidase